METLDSLNAEETARRQRAYKRQILTDEAHKLRTSIAKRNAAQIDLGVLDQIIQLTDKLPKDLVTRGTETLGMGLAGGLIARDALKSVAIGARNDANIREQKRRDRLQLEEQRLVIVEAELKSLGS